MECHEVLRSFIDGVDDLEMVQREVDRRLAIARAVNSDLDSALRELRAWRARHSGMPAPPPSPPPPSPPSPPNERPAPSRTKAAQHAELVESGSSDPRPRAGDRRSVPSYAVKRRKKIA